MKCRILLWAITIAFVILACSKSDLVGNKGSTSSAKVELLSSSEREHLIARAVEKMTPVLEKSYEIFRSTGAYVEDEEMRTYLLSTGYISQVEMDRSIQLSKTLNGLRSLEVRKANEEALLRVLSPEQKRFTDLLALRANAGERKFDDIYDKASKELSREQYQLVEHVLMATEVLIRSVDKFRASTQPSELRSSYLERFACGAVAGGIGSVWGTMAGGVLTLSMAVPVAGFVGGAVALVAGAAIGAALC